MKYAYWLDNISGIGIAKKRYLLETTCGAEELYEMPVNHLKRINGLTEEEVQRIIKSRKEWNVDKEWFDLMGKGVGFVSLEQKNFPEKLRNIPDVPYALYYIGSLPEENRKSVAIVGARGRSIYGCEIAQNLSKCLAEHGVQVISGLAKGIDTDAHKGALEGQGNTYAVLGSGVDVCYPKENKYLYNKIIDTGGIISEYPPGTEPRPGFFPLRNRIISGLSDCVVVIEAKEKSGSLITADFAMEQGRDVYALPGRITDKLSMGCNQLIKQGAGIVQSVEDFLADLDIIAENTCAQIDFRKNLLEKDERLVYSLIDFHPIGLGTLVDKTSFSIAYLLEILKKLDSLGLVKETFTNYYVRRIFK